AQEGRVQDVRAQRVHSNVSGALRHGAVGKSGRALEEGPRDAAVLRLPDSVRRVDRRSRAVGAAAATEDGGVQVVGVGRVHCAAPRTKRPLGRIVSAPMRPLSAVRAPVVRWTCPMGLGPSGAQVELNVLVPTWKVLALPAALDRLAPADSTLSGVSPAVMSSM